MGTCSIHNCMRPGEYSYSWPEMDSLTYPSIQDEFPPQEVCAEHGRWAQALASAMGQHVLDLVPIVTIPPDTQHVINSGTSDSVVYGYQRGKFGTLSNNPVEGLPEVIRFEGNVSTNDCLINYDGDVQISGVEGIHVIGQPVGGGGDIAATFVWNGSYYEVEDFAMASLFLQFGEGQDQDCLFQYLDPLQVMA